MVHLTEIVKIQHQNININNELDRDTCRQMTKIQYRLVIDFMQYMAMYTKLIN